MDINTVESLVEKYKSKLYDLTTKNPLISYKHSESSRQIRIIDELPDAIYKLLITGRSLAFEPLPQDAVITDESDKFHRLFEHAKMTDASYLNEVAALDEDDPNYQKRREVMEIELASKVRKEHGISEAGTHITFSNNETARKLGINPSFEMPRVDQNNKRQKHDTKLQTLLKPRELERKLRGLMTAVRSDLQEKGVNILFFAFGFLQWCEAENTKPVIAPLMLLPLDLEKSLLKGSYSYNIKAIEENSIINQTLRAKLLATYNMELPELDEYDSPETYMQRIEKLIISTSALPNKINWGIKRYLTVGCFNFANLPIYNDLNNTRWGNGRGISFNSSIQNLLYGDERTNENEEADYFVDKQSFEKLVPLLVNDADASQHSAIIDAITEKGLVIIGPPGTGKSQTITNIIACALARDEKVLFIAEKMAALDVVYKRLKDANLHHFCLELHSNKANKKTLLESLNERLQLKEEEPLSDIAQYDNKKDVLNRYASLMGKKLGGQGRTVFDYIWKYQRLRALKGSFPEGIELSFNYAQANVTSKEIAGAREYLALAADYHRAVEESSVNGSHPWRFVRSFALVQNDEFIKYFKDFKAIYEDFLAQADFVKSKYKWNITTLEEAERYRYMAFALLEQEALVNRDMLERFATSKEAQTFLEYVKIERERTELIKSVRVLKQPVTHYGSISQIENVIKTAENAGCATLNIAGFNLELNKHSKKIKECDGLANHLKSVTSLLGLELTGSSRLMTDVYAMCDVVKETPLEVIEARDAEIIEEENLGVLYEARLEKGQIVALIDKIGDTLEITKLGDAEEVKKILGVFEATGFIDSFFSQPYQDAKNKFVAACYRKSFSKSRAINLCRETLKLFSLELSFMESERLRSAAGSWYDGLNTNIDSLIAVNEWARDIKEHFKDNYTLFDPVRWLITAPVEELYKLVEICEARYNEYEPFVSLQELMTRCAAEGKRCGELMALYEKVLLLHNQYIDSPAYHFTDLKNEVPSLYKIEEAGKALKALGSNIEFIYKNFEGNEETLSFIRKCIELESSQELTDKLFPHYLKRIADYKSAAEKLGGALDLVLKNSVIKNATELLDLSKNLLLIKADIDNALTHTDSLDIWRRYYRHISIKHPQSMVNTLLKNYMELNADFSSLPDCYEYFIYKEIVNEIYAQHPELNAFDGIRMSSVVNTFRRQDQDVRRDMEYLLANKLLQNKMLKGVSGHKKDECTEGALIRKEIKSERHYLPIRQLFSKAFKSIVALKPCFLMSPLSIAQNLEPDMLFDYVIIDEASQMRTEEALGGIARGKKIVIVGDGKQLPPASFFQAQHTDDDTEYEIDEDILQLAQKRFPTRVLSRHYRSRHESLIAFSNFRFYKNMLRLFPAPVERSEHLGIRVYGVEGLYDAHINESEVRRTVEAATEMMREYPGDSIGVVTMNAQQQERLVHEMDVAFATIEQANEYRSRWEDGLEPFIIKNLENIQGDERDTIIISTVYGPGVDGVVRHNFGPINNPGGDRRLNVLFSRAKKRMVVVTSLKPEDIKITLNSSEGSKAFRSFLDYIYTGKIEQSFVTTELYTKTDPDFEGYLKDRLAEIGFTAVSQVGVSGYSIDLGIKHPNFTDGYLCGIECDGRKYFSSKSARERDIIRQNVLEGLGWKIYKVWSTDWLSDPVREFNKLKVYLNKLLEAGRQLPVASGQ